MFSSHQFTLILLGIARNKNIYFVNNVNSKFNQTAKPQIYYSYVNNHVTCSPRFTMVLISILHMASSPCGRDPSDTHLFLIQLSASPSAGFRINALSKEELDFDRFFPLVNWGDRYTWHLSKCRIEDWDIFSIYILCFRGGHFLGSF